MTYQPTPHSQPFQPPHSQPFQPPAQGQPFQPPGQGQPGQPHGQDLAPQEPQGPPRNARPGRSQLWPAAVVALALVVVAASFWMGSYLVIYENRGIGFYLLIALVSAAVWALSTVWSESAFEVRTWGSDLFGRTALGWRRVDLANLTSAAMAAFGRNRYVVVGDSQGRIMVSARKLGPVAQSVSRGLFEAAQHGRCQIPTDLAKLLGLPVQSGARRLGKSGHLARLFAVMGLILVGLVSGAVSVS